MKNIIGRLILITIFILSSASLTYAAVKKVPFQKELSALDKLNLPSSRRFNALKSKKSYQSLKEIAFNSDYKLGHRWRSMAVIASNFPKSKATKSGLTHKQWFMRNSALLGLENGNRKMAHAWAIKYLNSDPSLIVRSAAVDILSKNPSEKVKKVLRANIDNKLNFRKGKPLWVRKNILQAIYKMSTKTDLPNIMSELNKEKIDDQHSKFLFEALPRISGHNINTTPYDSEKKAWLSWWQSQNALNR